jgi:hypothetical protein
LLTIIVNKKIKYPLIILNFSIISITTINIYKKYFIKETFDLNVLLKKLNNSNEKFDSQFEKINDNNPFEILQYFDNNLDDYFINKMTITLYNPPLTNKLFPKSNLYGHELIRYYDF